MEAELKLLLKHASGDANKQLRFLFNETIMKYKTYMSLPFNSHDCQIGPDYGSGDFQHTFSRAICEHSACALPGVGIVIGSGT